MELAKDERLSRFLFDAAKMSVSAQSLKRQLFDAISGTMKLRESLTRVHKIGINFGVNRNFNVNAYRFFSSVSILPTCTCSAYLFPDVFHCERCALTQSTNGSMVHDCPSTSYANKQTTHGKIFSRKCHVIS